MKADHHNRAGDHGPMLQRAVISVNGIAIDHDAISREAQNHPGATPIDSWKKAARALVIRELLLQEARRVNIVAEPVSDAAGRRESADEALIRTLIENAMRSVEPGEQECRSYYEENLQRFTSGNLYEVAHILLPAPPGDAAARAAARRKATEIIGKLVRSPQSFAALAAEYSACPSAKQGGSLGQVGAGETAPEFEAALATLSLGEIVREPVETRYGLHVIRLDQKHEGRPLPYEYVAPRIREYLSEKAYRQALHRYTQELANKAVITGMDVATVEFSAAAPPGATPPLLAALNLFVSEENLVNLVKLSLDSRLSEKLTYAAAQKGQSAEHYAAWAIRRFSARASSTDWQGLISSLDRASDPAVACLTAMLKWCLGRDAAGQTLHSE